MNGENNSLWRMAEEAGLASPFSVARGGATATYERGGGVRRKSTSFGGFGGQQARLFVSFFSSYRTVNVVPFYLAVFPYFVVVIIHEKS